MSNWILWFGCLLIWAYLLWVLNREKMTAFRFLTGSIGFFVLVFTMLRYYLVWGCIKILEFFLLICSKIFPFYTLYEQYNVMFINHENAAISLFIDYECCGFIEILVVVSVILFFPLFKAKQRVIYGIVGVIYTMLANLIRLLLITYFIYIYGNNAYYVAHSVLGRIIFYMFTLFFYFYIISWNQIKKQKVGRFIYDDDARKNKNQSEG